MKLSEAEVVVTTQRQIDKNTYECDWFLLSDYGDTGEFYNACCTFFSDEKNPVFRYLAWENIPEKFINKNWFCPNFFEIRDALERLEESEFDYFIKWCDRYGHNIATDEPHVLVTNYQDTHTSCPEYEIDTPDIPDDTLIFQGVSSNYFDIERFSFEIFDDNYD